MAVYQIQNNPDFSAGPLKLIEQDIYGSSRIGVIQRNMDADQPRVAAVNANLIGNTYTYSMQRGVRNYELSNHLGNVLTTITDQRKGVDTTGDGIIDYYLPVVVSSQDYYPFGMQMPGRTFSSPSYRYGFNGKEKDSEVKGEGNQYDYGMRIYDPRVGKFLSTDPISKSYPQLTPYQYASNSPIAGSDLDGLEFENKAIANEVYTKFQKSNNKTTSQNIKTQQSVTFSSLLSSTWQGAKAGYREFTNSLSSASISKTYHNAVGTAKDFGNMMLAKPGAAQCFTDRVTNFSYGVSNSISQPFVFLSTMQNRSPNENAYGMGYYGLQLGIIVASEAMSEVLSEANSIKSGMVESAEGNGIIRSAINDGVTIRFAESVDDIAYMHKMNSKALYGTDINNPNGVITLNKGFGRADILEEAIHHQQRMLYGDEFFYNPENNAYLEVQAQDRLIEIGTKERWSRVEMDKIRNAKATWQKKLNNNK